MDISWATLDKRPSIFIRDNPILSLERMLHKAVTANVQFKKISGRDPQWAWRQAELTACKPPVVK
jgi:hypothetical protein